MEIVGAYGWARTVLLANATVLAGVGRRIYRKHAPALDPITKAAPLYPFIILNVTSNKDVNALGARRILSSINLTAKVHKEGGMLEDIVAIAKAMDAALTLDSVATFTFDTVTYQVLGSQRTEQIDDSGVENGIEYHVLGGTYHMAVKAV